MMQPGVVFTDYFPGRGLDHQVSGLHRGVQDLVEDIPVQDHPLAGVGGEFAVEFSYREGVSGPEPSLTPLDGVEPQGCLLGHFVVGVQHVQDGGLSIPLGVRRCRKALVTKVGAAVAPLRLVGGEEEVDPVPLDCLVDVLARWRQCPHPRSLSGSP